MTPRTARATIVVLLILLAVAAGVGLHALWSGVTTSRAAAPASPIGTADALQSAFVGVAERVRPAVVHVGTVQVARARRTPVVPGPLADDPFFKDFFDQFFGRRGPGPPEEFRQSGLGSGVIIDK